MYNDRAFYFHPQNCFIYLKFIYRKLSSCSLSLTNMLYETHNTDHVKFIIKSKNSYSAHGLFPF